MNGSEVLLPTRIRVADGRIYDGPLPHVRHRAIQLGMLHAHSRGYVEIAAGPRPAGGKTQITSRTDPAFYLPGGANGVTGWLEALLDFAEEQARKDRTEVFVGVTPRAERAGNKIHVHESGWLWVDIDQPDELPTLYALLERKPCQLLIASGGSGGAHAYWQLDEPLQARHVDPQTGQVSEPIERANRRLIHHLGRWDERDGKRVYVGADRACADRSRVMRLSGSVNYKTGAHARIVWADMALAPYEVADLVGDLPDMPNDSASGQRRRPAGQVVHHDDPYKRIAPADYFRVLAGVDVGQRRLVPCPSPMHEDRTPSCSVGGPGEGFYCHGCQEARGGIYDLASLILGGPTGPALRGEDFKRAQQLVREKFGAR